MTKLPVDKNTLIKSECWTHYRMEIMGTSNDFDRWLCSHLDLTVPLGRPCVMFGKGGSRCGLGYYDRILEESEINIKEMPPEKAINRIKQELDNGYYLVVFCNSSLVFEQKFEEPLHEVFIYGYDDQKSILFSSTLKDGKFIECEVPYINFIKGYKYRYAHLKQNKNEILSMTNFFYDITKIRLKKFDNDTFCLLEFFKKISNELNGGTYTYGDTINKEPVRYYDGIDCIIGIKKYMQDFIYGSLSLNKRYERFALSLLKIYEHKNILLRNFNYICNYYNINNPELKTKIKEYRICSEKAQIMYMLAYKNDVHHNGEFNINDDITKSTYKRIINMIDDNFEYEKDVLNSLLQLFSNWFHNARDINTK